MPVLRPTSGSLLPPAMGRGRVVVRPADRPLGYRRLFAASRETIATATAVPRPAAAFLLTTISPSGCPRQRGFKIPIGHHRRPQRPRNIAAAADLHLQEAHGFVASLPAVHGHAFAPGPPAAIIGCLTMIFITYARPGRCRAYSRRIYSHCTSRTFLTSTPTRDLGAQRLAPTPSNEAAGEQPPMVSPAKCPITSWRRADLAARQRGLAAPTRRFNNASRLFDIYSSLCHGLEQRRHRGGFPVPHPLGAMRGACDTRPRHVSQRDW
jgi:hypothetical protein